ncbi:MAG: DUF2726 domain-containing protein [Azoarcus sp.]|jgi:hypothetical protein|nr:DUF2726 domain-containing protein [Azoarcus sp.]
MGLTIFFLLLIAALVAAMLYRSKQLQKNRSQREAVWFSDGVKAKVAHAVTKPPELARGRAFVLDEAETRFYQKLLEAFPKMTVFAQVGLDRVLLLDGEGHAPFAADAVDFLVCKPSEVGIVPSAAIDLENPARASEKRQRNFEQKRRLLESAGIPLLLYPTSALPDVEALRGEVAMAVVERARGMKVVKKR